MPRAKTRTVAGVAVTAVTQNRRRRATDALMRLAVGATLAAAAALLLARAVHFATATPPAWLDRAAGGLMQAQLILFMNTVAHWWELLPGAALLLVVFLAAPRRWVRREGDRWRLRSGFRLAVAAGLLLGNVVLDVSPFVALWGWLSVALVFVVPRLWSRFPARRERAAALVAAGLLAAGLAWAAPSWIDALCLGLWAGVVVIGAGLARRLASLEVFAALAAALGLLQVAGVNAPLLWGGGGGLDLGPGYAYSFCELPDHSRVLAAVPLCSANLGLGQCMFGHVSEYDAQTGRPVARYAPFSTVFYGRALHLLCLEDRVQLGMAQTMIDGRFQREAVIELSRRPDAPAPRELLGGAVGHRMAYDRARDAVFYVSEWSGAVYRWDRARDEIRKDIGRALSDTATAEVSADAQLRHRTAKLITSLPLSLQTEIAAVHAGRGSVFFVEWLSGSRVFEVDTTTLTLRRVLTLHNGANHSLAVDEERDRLIVSGLWGVEVIDLGRGKVVARRRLGTGPRLPVIDRAHSLVYIPTTYGGGVWVLDRDTYRCLGRIDVGNGGRNALLSADGRFLYASSARAHYRWDTTALAKGFGR
jgi:hypothetical protein